MKFTETYLLSEPVYLVGEGEYNLNALTEIKSTESYLGLDEDVRECQIDEPQDNCTTRQYVESLMQQCGCLPFNIRLSIEEILFSFRININVRYLILGTPLFNRRASMY